MTRKQQKRKEAEAALAEASASNTATNANGKRAAMSPVANTAKRILGSMSPSKMVDKFLENEKLVEQAIAIGRKAMMEKMTLDSVTQGNDEFVAAGLAAAAKCGGGTNGQASSVDETQLEHDRSQAHKNIRDLKRQLQDGKEIDQRTFQLTILEFMSTTAAYGSMKEQALEKRVLALEKKLAATESRAQAPEIVEAKKGLIWRGLVENDKEDLAKVVGELFYDKLEVEVNCIAKAKRLPSSKLAQEKAKKDGKTAIRPVLIKFNTVGDKFNAFKKFHKLKAIQGSAQWKFSQEVPLCLKDKWNKLEKQGYELRQARPTIKTRIMWRGNDVFLACQEPGEKSFSPIGV